MARKAQHGAYAGVSYWLRTAGDDLTPRPPLDGNVRADVAILGAGFTGLWTAWYLLQREPGAKVVVCEAETAGFGASGRNGGWCSAGLSVSPGELARRYSADMARRTVTALRDTVEEIGRVCHAEGLDVHWRASGILRVARGVHEIPALSAEWDVAERLGLADGLRLLDADATAGRVRIAGAEGALFDPHAAVLHPGRLVRGLARLAENAGATIYEQTPVERVEPRTTPFSGSQRQARPALVTARGRVDADVVVVAGEAYVTRLPGWRRAVLPLYSLIVLTEPLSEAQWQRIGWQGHECLSSRRLTVDYLSRTADGRILFGGRGAPYHFRSTIRAGHDRHEPTFAALRRAFGDWFPALSDVRFAAAWGGPLAMSRDFMPNIDFDMATGIARAMGYTGQGVGASNLAGRALADLITGDGERWADLPMVGHRSRRWEPEPLRWLGARYVQRALAAVDARSARTGRPPTGGTPAERLMRH